MMILKQLFSLLLLAILFYVLFRFAKVIVGKFYISRYKKHMAKIEAIKERDRLDEERVRENIRKQREANV